MACRTRCMFYGNLSQLGKKSNSVIRSKSVTVKNLCNVLSIGGVTVYGHHPECRVTFGRGDLILFCRGVTIQEKTFCDIFSLYWDIMRYIVFLIFSVKSNIRLNFEPYVIESELLLYKCTTVWRAFIRVLMWQVYIFWACNWYKTRIEWKINSLIRRKTIHDILRYEFRIAIRHKFFMYCNISIYRYSVTPLLFCKIPVPTIEFP